MEVIQRIKLEPNCGTEFFVENMSFDIGTGKLFINDPIYHDETGDGGLLEGGYFKNVKNGKWNMIVYTDTLDLFGSRIMRIALFHEDNYDSITSDYFIFTDKYLPVDTGRGAIFDKKYDEDTIPKEDETYRLNAFDNGLICDSGIGDGIYPIYSIMNDETEKTVGIMIDFWHHAWIDYENKCIKDGII